MAWDRHLTIDDARAFLDTIVAPHYASRQLDYAVCLRGDPDTVIGGLGLYWQSRAHAIMELGYILTKACWGRGYVPEAGRALMAHAFDTTHVERIFAPIFAPNTKSRRAATKMGLSQDGVLRSAAFHRGTRLIWPSTRGFARTGIRAE